MRHKSDDDNGSDLEGFTVDEIGLNSDVDDDLVDLVGIDVLCVLDDSDDDNNNNYITRTHLPKDTRGAQMMMMMIAGASSSDGDENKRTRVQK